MSDKKMFISEFFIVILVSFYFVFLQLQTTIANKATQTKKVRKSCCKNPNCVWLKTKNRQLKNEVIKLRSRVKDTEQALEKERTGEILVLFFFPDDISGTRALQLHETRSVLDSSFPWDKRESVPICPVQVKV